MTKENLELMKVIRQGVAEGIQQGMKLPITKIEETMTLSFETMAKVLKTHCANISDCHDCEFYKEEDSGTFTCAIECTPSIWVV